MLQPLPQTQVRRDALGGIVIRSRVSSPPGRLGYEKQFFPGVRVGLAGWERAHSQGNITGYESAEGIRYAPSEVNQAFQRLGIEGFIRELFEEKAADVEMIMTTVTYTHPGTLRLKEIQYRIDVVRRGLTHPLFEASIEVENKKQNPRVTITATPRLPREIWQRYLR
ncbi:MAG TPA: polymorphic toxin type 4 domain-containing protein [Longimicrobiaceae bacterium]|nr:polymorphic toxin type 4 domain-containing protein [Longimicrobiaceae bacterium]